MNGFYIAYAEGDQRWAEWIGWQLEAAGHSAHVKSWDLRPGDNQVLKRNTALQEAARLIVVLSPAFFASKDAQTDWTAFWAGTLAGEERRVVPVVVQPLPQPLVGLLGSIEPIDLVGRSETAATETLLAGLQNDRAKPPVAPHFPGLPSHANIQKPSFPGSLPALWNLPARNPNFTGRGSLLAGLRDALHAGQPAAVIQAITGLGGVGKTQVAIEYAYRHTHEYALGWWVRAEEPATLVADYARLAQNLGLRLEDPNNLAAAAEAVRGWLEQQAGWLLIFDNATAPEAVSRYLPRGATGHVIITSRNAIWRDTARPFPVDVWSRGESIAFLQRRTGKVDAAADQLAAALGDLPLALEHAGAYIDQNDIAVATYLDLFRKHQGRLMRGAKPPKDYHATIATTWEISLRAVKKGSPAAIALMHLVAFLAPEDFPLDALRAGVQELPRVLAGAVADSIAFDEAISILRRYSLIERRGDALAVHRLVQAVIRDQLSARAWWKWAWRKWTKVAIRLVNSQFPFESGNVRNWPQFEKLLPHALAVVSHAEQGHVAPKSVSRLLNEVGVYLRWRAEFEEAKRAFSRALAINVAEYGPRHLTVATGLNNLAEVLHDLGDLATARAHFERALAIDEAVYGRRHPAVATDLNNLGSVLQDLGDLTTARAHYERSLAIDEAAYGPHQPTVSTDLNNLASVLRDLGDLATARAHFERALAIHEAAYGPHHPTVATDLNNLASVLQDQGDLATARAHLERALAIDEAVYGPRHPTVATRLNNLALVLKDLGNLATARAYCERALAIDEAVYGPRHPTVATDLNNLAGVLKDLGDLATARAHCERALAIDEAVLGPRHPTVATFLNNLAGVLRALGDLATARAHLERALAIAEAAYGPHHPTVAIFRNNLAGVMKELPAAPDGNDGPEQT
ncbi:MAG TPA: FxSxx-COOH system tetratricopeptide repeat protein [Symbiobacteriaceae bacterium]|jgi:tetratricopeptide (TPR) repeat protein